MREAIEKVLEAMREDYKRWGTRAIKVDSDPEFENELRTQMEEEFCDGLEVKEGPRYWKIISNKHEQRTVQGFVVKAGDKKFKEGDLLKPAGWAAPARNFPRGNVLTGWIYQNVRWTGIG